MKITFDLRNVGLGNNGGSFTLIKSGNTLVEMGHDITFIDSGKNQHTWVPLKATHLVVNNKSKIPEADFIIATGYKSVKETVSSPKWAGKKCHWIRGWETWQYNENLIIEKVLKQNTIKLVNGLCLQKKLKKLGFHSYLIRPGYDFQVLKSLNIRQFDPFIIGGLNSQGKHIRIKRTAWIFDTSKTLKRRYGNKIKLWMFGMDGLSNKSYVDHFVQNPSIKEKNNIYNNCSVWLSTSMLEGLHMPPAEAMITECPVVGTNAEMSGTEDYLINNRTGIVTNNDFDNFINGIEKLIKNEKLVKKLGKNAREKILELGSRKKNMKILENLFLELKNGQSNVIL